MRPVLGKASKREDTISHTHKDKPTWSQFHIFIFLHHKTVGLILFYFASQTKTASTKRGVTEIVLLEGKGENNGEKMHLPDFVSFLQRDCLI